MTPYKSAYVLLIKMRKRAIIRGGDFLSPFKTNPGSSRDKPDD